MTSPDQTDEPRTPGTSGGALEVRAPGEVASETSGASGTIAVTEEDGPESAPARPGRRSRRPLRTSGIVLVAVAVVAAAGAAATGAFGGEGDDSASAAPSGPPNTATVERTTLTESEVVDGNLGYGDTATLQAPAASGADSGSGQSGQGAQPPQDETSSGAGIITWLPNDGNTVKRGDTVYSVDDQKVPLLYGSTPLYRTLQSGTEGDDVEILEKNLSELGYTGFTTDDEYTSGTADAVRDWQEDLGREETGTVRPGDAVVADNARRIAEVKTSPGVTLSGAILTWTDTERIVTVDLDVQFEDLVEKGTKATVEMPDGTTAEGEVTDIGTPATPEEEAAAGEAGGGDDEATLPVEFAVEDQKKLGDYQAASVDVTLKAETRKDVLAVPVSALVAQPGGDYAVEAVVPNGTEYRPVELGMFAGGKVEISGEGIKDGLVVGVPK